jgi:hypothetical protein
MRLAITRINVGMVLIDANRRRLEIVERGTWRHASGGESWVQLRLRSLEDGSLSLRGYQPSQTVEVDSATVPMA